MTIIYEEKKHTKYKLINYFHVSFESFNPFGKLFFLIFYRSAYHIHKNIVIIFQRKKERNTIFFHNAAFLQFLSVVLMHKDNKIFNSFPLLYVSCHKK